MADKTIKHYSCDCGETAFQAYTFTGTNCYYCNTKIKEIPLEQLANEHEGASVNYIAQTLAHAKLIAWLAR